MSRRNQGPRLRFLTKCRIYYVVWTKNGRSRERSTGTSDREKAEVFLAQLLRVRTRREGPRDPAEVLVTDMLVDYSEEKAPKTVAPERIGYAVEALVGFWKNCTVSEITPQACETYGQHRDKSAGTIRRELGVLRAAINHAHRNGRLTRSVSVELPERPEPRDRWLTRQEGRKALALRSRQSEDAALPASLYFNWSLHGPTQGSHSLFTLEPG